MPGSILIVMNAFVRASAVTCITSHPVPGLLILGSAGAALILLVYFGIVLPAVWSAKPARRKAAAAVLQQILDAIDRWCRR